MKIRTKGEFYGTEYALFRKEYAMHFFGREWMEELFEVVPTLESPEKLWRDSSFCPIPTPAKKEYPPILHSEIFYGCLFQEFPWSIVVLKNGVFVGMIGVDKMEEEK